MIHHSQGMIEVEAEADMVPSLTLNIFLGDLLWETEIYGELLVGKPSHNNSAFF